MQYSDREGANSGGCEVCLGVRMPAHFLFISITGRQVLSGPDQLGVPHIDSGKECLEATKESYWMTRSLRKDQSHSANELQAKEENRHNEQSFVMAF